MEDFLPLYYYISEALFFGFGFIIALVFLPYPFVKDEVKKVIYEFVQSGIKLIRIVALIYFLVAIGYAVKAIIKDPSILTNEDMIGNGSAFFWIKLIAVPLLCQLFWLKRVRKHNLVLFLIAIGTGFLFLILNERFIIILTTIHRDYGGSNRATYITEMLFYYLRYLGEQLLIFLGCVLVFHLYRVKKNGIK